MAYGKGRKQEEDPRFVRAGGLWEKRDRKDRKFLVGGLLVGKLLDYLDEIGIDKRNADERVPVMIFENTYKEEENHPDFNLYLTDPDRERQGGGKSRGRDREERSEERSERAPRREERVEREDPREEQSEEKAERPSRRRPAEKPEKKNGKTTKKRLRLSR